MIKASSFLLVVLCGLGSFSLADPNMYGAAPAKYPAPVSYPATPAPPKYEAPTTYSPPKYEIPAKYEAPKYEEKKEEYPMKPEYKTPEYPMKPAYKKEEYPMKKEYGAGMKYKRSVDDKAEESTENDAVKISKKAPKKISAKNVKALRDVVIESILSDPKSRWIFGGLGRPGGGIYYGRPTLDYRGRKFPIIFDDEDDLIDHDQFFDMDEE